MEDIPEEAYSNQIIPIIDPKAPIIRPKLDETIPSILNLSSEKSSYQKSRKASYNNDEYKYYNNSVKKNNVIPLFNFNPNFIKTHYKANSNEVFSNPKIFNFLGSTQETEKINKDGEDDDSSYYCEEFNINEVVNYWDENFKENNEDIKKKLFIDFGNENHNEFNDEGLNILNMLKNRKAKNDN